MKINIAKEINTVGAFKEQDVSLDLNSLLKHFIVFGGSGSGKTYLLKKIIETTSLNKVPILIIDTQGDFSSLILAKKEFKKVDKLIFTPTKKEGIPLSFSPFFDVSKDYDSDEILDLLSNSSDSLCSILDYDFSTKEGKSVNGLLYLILKSFYETKKQISFNSLIEFLDNLNSKQKNTAGVNNNLNSNYKNVIKEINQLVTKREISNLIKKLKLLLIGRNKLIFDGPFVFDLDILFDSPRLNIINLSGIENNNVRHYVINIIISNLYSWMIKNPSPKLQALFAIDEVSEYIPSGLKKPLTKDLFQLLFKQARKFGLSCLIATQNPGDIDYKSLAQFSSWAIGRLNTKQDFKKIENAINSISTDNTFSHNLPSLKTGQFLFYSPDNFESEILFQTNELLSEHKTLSLKDIEKLFDRNIIEDFLSKYKFVTKEINNSVGAEINDSQIISKLFPINVEGEQLSNIIQKHKKRFLMMFSELEQVGEVKLNYLPIYLCNLKLKEHSLFGLKSKLQNYTTFFNALTLNPMNFNHFDFHLYKGFNYFLNLNTPEINVLKLLFFNNKLTPNELSLKLDLSLEKIKNTIKKLKEHNYLVESIHGAKSKYSVMINIDIPLKMKKISTYEDYSFFKSNSNINDFELQDITKLKEILNLWFGDLVIESHELIYLPYYDIVLTENSKKRILKINASSGNVIEFN